MGRQCQTNNPSGNVCLDRDCAVSSNREGFNSSGDLNDEVITITAAGCTTLLWGCSTDIELNAPYDRTPVVFGLLDAAQDTQWVRVNRTWLGDGNQFDAALIADSSEYPAEDLTVRIQERVGGSVAGEWALMDTVIENKSEDGIFYAPEHQMWYFVPQGGLNTDAEYDLTIAIASEAEEVSSTTNMIAEQIGNITQPPPGVNNFKLGFASPGFTTTYPDITFKWSSTAGASRYDVTVFIHVIERIWSDWTTPFSSKNANALWNGTSVPSTPTTMKAGRYCKRK